MKNITRSTLFVSLVMIGIGLLTLGLILFIELSSRAQAQQSLDYSIAPVQVNYVAPEVKLADLNGKARTLADYRGQVVLVNLWATWCPPCKAELPALESFYQDHKEQGFMVIGVDDGEAENIVRPFINDYGLTYPVWLDPDFQTERSFGTINLPSSWVVNRHGQVVLSWYGAISFQKLDEYVKPLIEE